MTAIPTRSLQRTKSWFKWLLGFICPNRTDVFIVLISFLCLIGLAEPYLEALFDKGTLADRDGEFLFVALAGCFFGISLAAGWQLVSWKTTLAILMGVVIACGVASLSVINTTDLGSNYFWGQETIAPLRQELWLEWLISVAKLLVLSGLSWLITWLVHRGQKRAAKKLGQVKSSRSKILIGTAIVLFVLGMIQNLFFPFGFAFEITQLFEGHSQNSFAKAISGGILFSVLLIISRIVTGEFHPVFKLIAVVSIGCMIALAIASSSLYTSASGFPTEKIAIYITLFLAPFICAPFLITKKAIKQKRLVWPTFWSLASAILVAAGCYVVYSFNLVILFNSGFVNWADANNLQTIERQSNGTIRSSTSFGSSWSYLTCVFSESTPPDVFSNAGKIKNGFSYASIRGLRPEIDISPIAGAPSALHLDDSTISRNQAEDLLQNCQNLSIGKVKTVGSKKKTKLESVLSIDIEGGNVKSSSEFLKSIEALNPNGCLQVTGNDYEFDQDDFDTLVKISQRFPVLIESGICLQIIAKRLRHKQRIDGICLQWADQILSSKDYFTPEETQRFIEYILRNPIGIAYWLPEQEQLYWDLAFAKSNSAFPANVESHVDRLQLLVGSNAKDCVRLANEFHWSFGTHSKRQNPRKQLTGLYIPFAEQHFMLARQADLMKFQSLESLCFDPSWITRISPYTRMLYHTQGVSPNLYQVSGKSFELLPNLKRLDLYKGCEISDANFPTYIPNIEHLQVRFTNAISAQIDFSVCKRLKSLVCFGAPSKPTMLSLARLKNLESITVVDIEDGSLFDQSIVKQIKNAIPSVKIDVIMADDFYPTPPPEFVEHVKRTGLEIREKYGVENIKEQEK